MKKEKDFHEKYGMGHDKFVEYIKAPAEKMQEVLANYTSEELIHEVHRRNNIYISGWWNSDHILDNTGLPTQYHNAFFSYCNKYPLEDNRDIREPVEHWLESAKEDIKAIIMDWFNSTTQHVYNNLKLFDFIDSRLEICYEDDLRFYPFIDLSYKKEDGDAEDIQNTIFDLITVFKPHQGNLKTHLEEKMQELINEYFSF